MNVFYDSRFLPCLTIAILLFVMMLTVNPTVNAGSNNNAFIITTVDNIKGQYTMLVFQSVCSSESYTEYEYVMLDGHSELYDKSCICEKFQLYHPVEGEAWLYKRKFWEVIGDCEVPYLLNEFPENGVSGDIKSHQSTADNDRAERSTKIVVNEMGALEMVTSFSIYPNPAKEYVVLDYHLKEGDNIQLFVYDALGKEVGLNPNSLSQEAGNHSLTYNISDLHSGVYFYMVLINDQKTSGRLIVSH